MLVHPILCDKIGVECLANPLYSGKVCRTFLKYKKVTAFGSGAKAVYLYNNLILFPFLDIKPSSIRFLSSLIIALLSTLK